MHEASLDKRYSFKQTLSDNAQALQLLQHEVISSDIPMYLTKDVVEKVKSLWDLPNENNSNPRTTAIKLVRQKAKDFGHEIDLKTSVEIVKNHCL